VVISGFQWGDDSHLHIERHEFTPEEVEEAFAGDHKIRRTRQKRYIAFGETLDGRLNDPPTLSAVAVTLAVKALLVMLACHQSRLRRSGRCLNHE